MINLITPRLGVLLLTGISLLGLCSLAPVPNYRQQLLAAYHQLLGAGQAMPTGVYHLQFSSTSRYQAPGRRTPQEVTVQGELLCQGRKCYLQTERLRFWQDERYAATVLPAQRTVILTRVPPNQRAADPRHLLGLRDSLLSLGVLQPCSAERQGGQVRQHLQLVYNKKLAAQLHLRQLDFWLGAAHTLQQVRVAYSPGSSVQETTLRFAVQEWLPASTKLPADARRAVLTAQGQLVPAFQGYRLVNQIPAGQ